MKKLLIKELKEIAKTKGFLSVQSFIKDFNLSDDAALMEVNEGSENWKLSIRKGHSFEYITGFNFGW